MTDIQYVVTEYRPEGTLHRTYGPFSNKDAAINWKIRQMRIFDDIGYVYFVQELSYPT